MSNSYESLASTGTTSATTISSKELLADDTNFQASSDPQQLPSNFYEASTNLIINYLPQCLTNEQLQFIFSQFGEIESCKIIYDKLTGQSLCYGFIKFAHIEHAEEAVRKMNGQLIQEKNIKVSFARPSSESIKGANLYICGIPRHWTTADLNSYFSQCGKIITTRLLANERTGQSKGCGFIRFDQRFEAESAIKKLNGMLPYENAEEPITLKFANYPAAITNKAMASLPLAAAAVANVYSTSKSQLLNTISLSQQLTLNKLTQMPLYGNHVPVTQFNLTPTTSAISVNEFNQTPLQGSITSFNNSNTISPRPAGTGWCVFVYNLKPEIEENILWQLFGPFGAVQNVKVVKDFQTQKCKGYGFVTMTNYDEAVNAINSLNGFVLTNRPLQVSFKKNKATFQ